MAKIRNFDSFGGCIPTFLFPKREIWHLRSAPPCKILRLPGERVAPTGRKPIFGLLSKNKTGMAALRAGLPVNSKIITYLRLALLLKKLTKSI